MADLTLEDQIQEVSGLLDHHDRVSSLNKSELLDLHARALSLYGISCNEGMIPKIMGSYRRLLEITTSTDRKKLLLWLADIVDEGKMHGNALYPFMFVDPDLDVVSTATIRFAEAGIQGGEPLARVHEALQNMGNASLPGGIVGGLQAMGDARLLEVLDEAEQKLPNDQLAAAARCSTGFPTMASIEFWIHAMETWADYLDRATDSESYQYIEQRMGYLASGLSHVFTKAQVGFVLDSDRNFGFPWMEPRPSPIRHRARASIRQAAGVFGPRLYRLEEREKRPHFDVPHLLRVFGLRPTPDRSSWSELSPDKENVLRMAEERAQASWDTGGPETLRQELLLLGVSAEVSRELDYPVPIEVTPKQDPEGTRLFLSAEGVGLLAFFELERVAVESRSWLEHNIKWEMLSTMLGPVLEDSIDSSRREDYARMYKDLHGRGPKPPRASERREEGGADG